MVGFLLLYHTLSTNGGSIQLLDANGQTVHVVTYQDHSGTTPGLYVKFE